MPDKNGANRGGARPGAGRKKKPLTERIEAGQKATVLKAPEVDALEMPKIKDYFKAEQRMGELYAAEVYQETWDWLKERGCATLINPMLLEQYAMSAARWVQLEGINSQYGFISKTAQGNATASPFVTQALAYPPKTGSSFARSIMTAPSEIKKSLRYCTTIKIETPYSNKRKCPPENQTDIL